MDLRRVFSRVSGKVPAQKSDKDSVFLAVKISSASVLATVWTINDGKVTIGEVACAQLVEKNFEHLLKSCDQAISKASISSAPDVKKVIFAVPHNWISEGKILPEHLQTLRRLCKELDLIPLGYVVTIEALESYYKEVEGAPLTAILIGVDEDQSVLTIFRAGRDLGTVPLSINITSEADSAPAIESAVKKFSHIEALPSRIILYDSGRDLEPLAQKITAYPWMGRLPFLHFPKVEQSPAEFVITAVAAAGGLQMGASFDPQQLSPSRIDHAPQTFPQEINDGRINSFDSTSTSNELEEVPATQAGFITQSDFHEISFPMGTNKEVKKPEHIESVSSVSAQQIKILSKISSVFSFIRRRLKFPKLTRPSLKFPLLLPAVALCILVIAVIISSAVIYFFPKADIVVSVNSRNFNHELPVSITTSEASGSAQESIAGSFIETSEIGTKKISASGKKLVGTKAKGNVAIFGVSDSRKFPANTVITAPNGLKFTLDTDASVASGDAVTPSTTAVSVHAANIGDTYNLPSGTKFTIGSLSSSDYLAKNDSALSGGTSHEATVVTKSDQDKLFTDLSDQLTAQAKTDLQSKLGPSQTLLPNAVTSAVSKKKFSKDVDDESDFLSLDLTMDFRAVVFSKEDVIKLFSSKFASELPAGYFLTLENTKIEVVDAKTDKKGNTILTLSVNASLSPEIDSAGIISRISGKNFAFASEYISALPGVASVQLHVKPDFFAPVLKTFLPWKKDNLKVEIVTQ